MSITGIEKRRRRSTVVVVEQAAATTSPAIAAQERKAAEPRVERLESEVASKAPAAHSHALSDVTGLVAALAAKLDASSYTAADVLAKLLTVDGSGSGIDADLLDGQSSAAFAAAAHTHTRSIVMGFDGGGSTLSVGSVVYVQIPYAFTITAATLDAQGETGSIVLDVWAAPYASFPPTVANTITASAKPTLSAAQKARDTTLTGWTKTFAAGYALACKIDSVSSLTKVRLTLEVST